MSGTDKKVKTKTSSKRSKDTHGLIYAVQKHNTMNMHYDFRLEWNGVLLSWAIPKGPSMNPDDKRLAIMVDDHNLEYASFEGEIAKDKLGSGSVEIWDKGIWEPKYNFSNVKKALDDGILEFYL